MANKNYFLDTFVDNYRKIPETKQDDFSRIVSRFLNETFILKEVEGDWADYFFVQDYRDTFESYFALIDYAFIYNADMRYYYIQTEANRNRVRLNKFDTVVLLVLRRLYHNKKQEITSNDKILVSIEEIVSHVRTTNIFNPEKKLNAYVDTLRKFRLHKIVDFTGSKLTSTSMIQVLSSILVIIPQDEIENIAKSLEALKDEEGGEENEEMDED